MSRASWPSSAWRAERRRPRWRTASSSSRRSPRSGAEQAQPPGLGLGHLVEREEVQPGDLELRIGERRRRLAEELVRAETAWCGDPGERRGVRLQEAHRLADPDLG